MISEYISDLPIEETENRKLGMLDKYRHIFLAYETQNITLEDALIELFKNEGLNNADSLDYTADLIAQCKTIIEPRLYLISQKYKKISRYDAYTICSYTCEAKNGKYSPYRLLNRNLASEERQMGIRKISKYLYVLLKSLRKLDRYYPSQTNKNLYRCITKKVNLEKDPNDYTKIPYIIGYKKTFWAFTSTSPTPKTPIKFLGISQIYRTAQPLKEGTIFTLTGAVWGYDITLFNFFDEDEILLEPERTFIIDNIIPSVNEVINITCRIIETPLVLSFIGGLPTEKITNYPYANNTDNMNNNVYKPNINYMPNNGKIPNNNIATNPNIDSNTIKIDKNILLNRDPFIAKFDVVINNNGTKQDSQGIGYLCNIRTKNIKVLITYNYMINLNYLNNIIQLTVYINNNKREIDMKSDRYIYTNEQLDITMIEILDYDNISTFLEIDNDIASKDYINQNIQAYYLKDWDKFCKTDGTIIKKNNDNYICNIKSLTHGIILNKSSQLIGVIKKKNINDLIEFIPMKIIINKINYIKCIYDIKRDNLGMQIQIINNTNNSGDKLIRNREIINNLDIIIEGKINSKILTGSFRKEGLYTVYLSSNEIFTNTSYMFYGCSSLKQIDFSNFDTREVTDMSYMFYECSSLEQINLASFNTDKVIDMSCMFSECSSLKNLDLLKFNTNQVQDMGMMFSGCTSLKQLNLSSFSTNKVTNMSSMFSGCSSLESLNLQSFYTNEQTNVLYIFNRCLLLKQVNCMDPKIIKQFKKLIGDDCCNII